MTLLGGLIPQHRTDERTMLLDYLERQRALVHWKLEGLSDEAARGVATPSGLTIHGLVRHLENVERAWLREHFAGQQGLHFDWSAEAPDLEMKVPQGVTLGALLKSYRAETDLCDDLVGTSDLDDVSAKRDHTLRWVLLHLIEETSRHVGHLDLMAELADGRVGEEPEGAPPPGEDP